VPGAVAKGQNQGSQAKSEPLFGLTESLSEELFKFPRPLAHSACANHEFITKTQLITSLTNWLMRDLCFIEREQELSGERPEHKLGETERQKKYNASASYVRKLAHVIERFAPRVGRCCRDAILIEIKRQTHPVLPRGTCTWLTEPFGTNPPECLSIY
jgi:hypothetical protein